MRFKTKQKGALKADAIHQAEQILFRFVQTKSLQNVSKPIKSSKENLKTSNIAHRGEWNNLSEMPTEAFKPWSQCQTLNIVNDDALCFTSSVGESTSRQLNRRHTVCKKRAPSRIVDCWIKNCVTKKSRRGVSNAVTGTPTQFT